ncbi:hypothetical protein M413DRAFT_446981 [Hebeloma cylindrosporum]|uniref:Cyanovirin-N domain-containing protein n=1 Tax=Hebeloma cylindrosporum TaxID=76867 RepID=A0A0C2XPB2_HEBCY|nr:hypothetical protein M413DRAFT_446981 [Hebeloma cylindrosporum h7]
MSISTTCRKVIINKGILSAECLKSDNKTYVSSSISLDNFLGNVDGKFVLGGKNFSQAAQDVGIIDGVLYAKLQAPGNKYVDAKFDLHKLIINNDGILTATVAGSIDVAKAKPPVLEKTLSTASTASAASAASALSAFSASSTTSSLATSVSSHSSSSYQKSSSTFHSSSFRSQSQQYLIEDTCSNFQLKEGFFHLDFNHSDGRVSHTSIDLNLYIGNVNGRLQWDASGFSKTCTSIRLEGFFLVADCLVPAQNGQKEHYVTTRLDLRTHFRISGGIIIYVETNKKLSMMLSEVPWMKFKVIAEPDLSVFGSHPVVKQTLARIAESTVEHVTVEMHKMLTIAMEEAIVAITASAMKHVSLQMEHTVRDAVGYAAASPSVTEAEYLHISQGFYGGGAYGGGGYAAGGGYAVGGGGGYGAGGGYVTGGGYTAGGYTAGGYGGGAYAGGAKGTNGTLHVGGGGVGGGAAYSAESKSVSGSVSASQSVSRSESYSSETSTAASATIAQAGVQLVSAQN